MCGIAGIAGPIHSDELIQSMINIMKHRGPDSDGFFITERVKLGHCRLSINDLSENANQPFISDGNDVAILVNGEIYNYEKLRKPLIQSGHAFQSASDSEVVLHGYIEKGIEFIKELNGMFAIAIFDGRTNELYLARDRLGIKPLYYSKTQKNFIFASEIKAIAQFDVVELSTDPQSLLEYFCFENYFSNRTLCQNIKIVLPGEIIKFYLNDSKLDRYLYWSPRFEYNNNFHETNIYEKYLEILESSVKRHLLSDVPLGTYLSSGIDSSSVAYYSSNLMNKPIETFTGAFGIGGFYDESDAARDIASSIGCQNNCVDITPEDFIENIENILWHLDEPRVGMGSFSQYMVAKKASKHVKVILTGHGGDEFFAGYPVFKAIYGKKQSYRLFMSSSLRELMYVFYFIVYPKFRKENRYFLPNIYSIKSLNKILKPGCYRDLFSNNDVFTELEKLKRESTDEYENLINTYMKFYLPALFTVEDKISMAFSLESRTPLCDNEMIDYSLSIPLSIKLKNNELKHIPRNALRNKLPEFMFNLPKRGFPTPLRLWFKKELKTFIREYILDKVNNVGFFNVSEIKKLLNRYTENKLNTIFDEIESHKIWVILNLIIFFENQTKRYQR